MTCNDEKVWMTNYSQNPGRHNPTTFTFNGKSFVHNFWLKTMTDGGLQEVQFVLKAIKLKCGTISEDHEQKEQMQVGVKSPWQKYYGDEWLVI